MRIRLMAAALMAAATAALAGSVDPFAGLSREQLLEGAKKEGSVLWYAVPIPMNDVIVSEFEKKYPGVKVEVLKGGGTLLLQKFELEQESGSPRADCITSGLTEAYPRLREKGYIADLRGLPDWKKRPGWSEDPHGSYFYYANFKVGLMYNTKLIPADQAPRSFAELAEPRWRQQVALFDTTAGFAIPLFRFLLEHPSLGWAWLDKLKANDPLLMVNAAQVDEAVGSGRRAVAIVRDTEFRGAQRKGVPVAFRTAKEGFMLHMMPVAVSSRAAHPYAARLFLDWLLSDEAQDRLSREGVGVPLRGDEKTLKSAGGWYLDAERVDAKEAKDFMDRLNAALHR